MHDDFVISYTALHPGTERTIISFHDGQPDLGNLFYPEDVPHIPITAESDLQKPSSRRRIFVADEHTAALPPVKALFEQIAGTTDCVLVLPAGEEYKTIEHVLLIVKTAIDHGLQRSSIFTGIGGGVISDMTAFAASLFKRGAHVELVPTTLLAMVDAAIGGKTGCDFNEYKNMIGSFFPANRLYVFPEFIRTLPEAEYRSGLAEVLKTAMLYAPKLYQILQTQPEAVKAAEPELLIQMIKRCVQAKAHVVEHDLAETGLRMHLNLGHTFGHALETAAGLGAISHGDAVAWGLGRALDLSVRLGLCEPSYRDELFTVLGSYGWCSLPVHPILAAGNLSPVQIAAQLVNIMKKDKKNTESSIRCILQRDINSTLALEVAESDIRAVLGDISQ